MIPNPSSCKLQTTKLRSHQFQSKIFKNYFHDLKIMNDSKITTKMSLKMNVYTNLKIIILNTSNTQIYPIRQFNNHDACE